MTWKVHVLATKQRRMFSRILQVLESQMVDVHSFAGETSGDETRMSFHISSQLDKADRVKALVYRLEGIRQVKVFADF